MKQSKRLEIRIEKSLLRSLTREAKTLKQSKTALVRQLLVEYFKEQELVRAYEVEDKRREQQRQQQ
jgi:Ribbon-helix-helix protein, copG family